MSNLYNRIINGLVYLQTPLKAFEINEQHLLTKYSIIVKELDSNNNDHLNIWVEIINNSYDDCRYNATGAKDLLTNHPYLDNVKTYLFQERNGQYCATVSVGIYKGKPYIGSDFRIGVHRDFQGKGYGRLLILYAYSKLYELGVNYGETIIAFKRKQSLYLHYTLGFKPQYCAKYIACPSYSKLKKFNIILTLRLKRHYKNYLKSLNEKYL